VSKEEMVKHAKALLELYEKATPALKPTIEHYLRQMHRDLVNADHTTKEI
jgi:hypothetical protein